MSKSKILFCRYKSPFVEPLAEWNEKFKKHGEKCVRLHNDTVISPAGEFDDEFWFLETTIKGKTSIITLATEHDFPTNHAPIMEKLAAYLDSQNVKSTGSFSNRGQTKKEIVPPQSYSRPIEVHYTNDNVAATTMLAAKLSRVLGAKATVTTSMLGESAYIHIVSYELKSEDIWLHITRLKNDKPGQ